MGRNLRSRTGKPVERSRLQCTSPHVFQLSRIGHQIFRTVPHAMSSANLNSDGRGTDTKRRPRSKGLPPNPTTQLPTMPFAQRYRNTAVGHGVMSSVIAPRSNDTYHQQPTPAEIP